MSTLFQIALEAHDTFFDSFGRASPSCGKFIARKPLKGFPSLFWQSFGQVHHLGWASIPKRNLTPHSSHRSNSPFKVESVSPRKGDLRRTGRYKVDSPLDLWHEALMAHDIAGDGGPEESTLLVLARETTSGA